MRAGPDDKEQAILAALDAAKRAWPGVVAADDAFLAALRARLEAEDAPPLDALHVADLYLAFACAAGDAAALKTVEREHIPSVRSMLKRLGYTPEKVDDALQAMRADLFVGAVDQPPGVLRFGGAGSLKNWLRVVAGHMASRLDRRDAKGPPVVEGQPDVADVARDPELDLLVRTYGAEVTVATREALRRLTVRERLLLKQRYRHALGVEALGALHGVDPSTISRWVTRARERLVEGTYQVMRERLGLSASDVLSVMRLIESRLDVTLTTLDDGE